MNVMWKYMEQVIQLLCLQLLFSMIYDTLTKYIDLNEM